MAGRSNSKIVRRIGESWAEILAEECSKTYMRNVGKMVANQRKVTKVYPPKDKVFRAFKETPFTSIKVVIVGQDPYHNGQADGLAFSSSCNKIKIPYSLRVIFEEIEDDLDIEVNQSADLTRWAKQGVFLINTALTVRAGDANSHSGIGWEKFTSKVINFISISPTPTVFILWGNHAKSFRKHIDEDNHLVLEAPHPASELYSGGTSGFYGCKHFSKTNNFLIKNNLTPITWK